MTDLEIMDGSPGLSVDEVAHIMLPGRGRNETGAGLSPQAHDRTEAAATFYMDQLLGAHGGVIVPSGYKSPADKAGWLWIPNDGSREEFRGIPEAELMRLQLMEQGIGQAAIHVERHSFDTVTNFTNVENGGYFPDRRPVAIVAGKEQLERIIKKVAPRTFRREFLGVVAPETSATDPDSFFAGLASQAVLLGIQPDTPGIVRKTEFRIGAIWKIVNLLSSVKPLLNRTPYVRGKS